MAKSRFQLNDISPWEILGGFFGYFAVANDVPDILRKLSIRSLVPNSLEKCLLEINPSTDFWYLSTFTFITFVGFFGVVSTSGPSKENPNQDTKSSKDSDLYKELKASMKRMRKISIIRSFGLVLVREWILNRFKISLYGTFKRPSEWEKQPERFSYIDRINYEQGNGYEFQYLRNFKQVVVRTHPFNNSTYGPEEIRLPTRQEYWHLLFASNIFPLWFLIHILRRPWS